MKPDEHIDPFDYIDTSDRYYDYYDLVEKNAKGEVWITRNHCDFLPSTAPYLLTVHISERFPFVALTPESRSQAERLAATLAGGDQRVGGKSYTHYNEGIETSYGKATLIKSPPYTLYAPDEIWKRADGEVVILRKHVTVPLLEGVRYFSLIREDVFLNQLTDECSRRVQQLATNLEGNVDRRWNKSWCRFRWEDYPARLLDPSNYLVTLRGEDDT